MSYTMFYLGFSLKWKVLSRVQLFVTCQGSPGFSLEEADIGVNNL